MGHEDGKKIDLDTIVYEWPSCMGSFVRKRRKEECRGSGGRQRRKSPWPVMRTRDIRIQPPRWKAAIGTGNSFVVAKADTSAMASTFLPRYDDGAHQPKVDPSHSPGDDVGCFEFGPPKIGYDRDYNDSPEGEAYNTAIYVLCARAPPGAAPEEDRSPVMKLRPLVGTWRALNLNGGSWYPLTIKAVHDALDASPGHRIYRTPDANPAPQPLGIATNEMIVPAFAGIGRVKRRDS
ncbi:hypothetical protein EV421DRAFT_1743057 [Armillaria borealis]|uniref:Uncharacterized protein n=1 Tax=Armillaria borealis TaxID=47425 RepID=A0AA39IW28_9AGAR|nr:hypothetical protein EV421DRAFT_1743057 [Armillaria borealis]